MKCLRRGELNYNAVRLAQDAHDVQACHRYLVRCIGHSRLENTYETAILLYITLV